MENHGGLLHAVLGRMGLSGAYQSNLKWRSFLACGTSGNQSKNTVWNASSRNAKRRLCVTTRCGLKPTARLGIAINQDKAYWTYKDSYIEREWFYLKRAWEQNLLEEGHYVVAYCPGCQTSLSSAEVGYEGSYKEVEDPSLYFKFKVTGTENEFFLVWTTMPFTIITDTMLAVQPKAEYVKVKVGEETWIMVRQRVEPVMAELEITNYQITESMTGKSLRRNSLRLPTKRHHT